MRTFDVTIDKQRLIGCELLGLVLPVGDAVVTDERHGARHEHHTEGDTDHRDRSLTLTTLPSTPSHHQRRVRL